jgi:hypothetical protein
MVRTFIGITKARYPLFHKGLRAFYNIQVSKMRLYHVHRFNPKEILFERIFLTT